MDDKNNDFCEKLLSWSGQLNSLQNAGNNTEIKPLRRAANYSGSTHSGAFTLLPTNRAKPEPFDKTNAGNPHKYRLSAF